METSQNNFAFHQSKNRLLRQQEQESLPELARYASNNADPANNDHDGSMQHLANGSVDDFAGQNLLGLRFGESHLRSYSGSNSSPFLDHQMHHHFLQHPYQTHHYQQQHTHNNQMQMNHHRSFAIPNHHLYHPIINNGSYRNQQTSYSINSHDLHIPQQHSFHLNHQYLQHQHPLDQTNNMATKTGKKRILYEDDNLHLNAVYPSPEPPKKAKLNAIQSATPQHLHHSTRIAQQDTYTGISSPLPPSPQSPFLPNVMPAGFDSLKQFTQKSPQTQKHLAAEFIPAPQIKPIAIPKKPSAKKDAVSPTIELPHRIDSDNSKRSWELIKSIGKGGCGEVYLAREIPLNKPSPFVAIKIIKDRKQFLSELSTMKTLNDHEYGRGYTPKLIVALKKRKALVMEYLSDTISARFERNGYRFSLKTICMLAMNMMSLVRDFNEKTGQAHVDIKPSNLCTSPNGRDLFLIDFGYSTSPHVKLPGQTGTPLFMACNLQTIGATYPSLQDDYESIGYVLMFLISGGKKGLPWGTLRTHKEIAGSKNDVNIHQYCQSLIGTEFEPLAHALSDYLFHCRDRTRPFTSTEYAALYQEWTAVLHSCGWTNDKMYDWVEQESLSHSSLTLINSQSAGISPTVHQLPCPMDDLLKHENTVIVTHNICSL